MSLTVQFYSQKGSFIATEIDVPKWKATWKAQLYDTCSSGRLFKADRNPVDTHYFGL